MYLIPPGGRIKISFHDFMISWWIWSTSLLMCFVTRLTAESLLWALVRVFYYSVAPSSLPFSLNLSTFHCYFGYVKKRGEVSYGNLFWCLVLFFSFHASDDYLDLAKDSTPPSTNPSCSIRLEKLMVVVSLSWPNNFSCTENFPNFRLANMSHIISWKKITKCRKVLVIYLQLMTC